MNLEDYKKHALATDPQFKAEYEKLQPKYELIRQMLEIRKAQGLTQKELAQKTGLKQSAVSRLETGRYNPSLAFLAKLAQGMGKQLKVEFV